MNSYYEDGNFYIITHALSNKMKQIEKKSTVAICGEWFTAHGIGENIGHGELYKAFTKQSASRRFSISC